MASVATLRDLIDALIESAKEDGKLDNVISDMESFFSLLSERVELRKILGSTAYSHGEQTSIIGDIGANGRFDPMTVNFLTLVIELDRFKSLLETRETIMRRLRKVSGKAVAELTAAEPPSDEDLLKIKESLTEVIGRDIEVEIRIRPEIIGGMIAKVEDKIFDGSIKTQLENMRIFLTTA